MIMAKGATWFGKFGLGCSPAMVAKARAQLDSGLPCYLYLHSKGAVRHRGRIVAITAGHSSCSAPEPALVPSYYRDVACSIWFKLTELVPAEQDEARSLVLFNETITKPPLSAQRGLMYVTGG